MNHPIVLFDGVCNLCNSSVQWLIERDPDGRFRYASLQSQAAHGVLSAHLTEEEIEALPDAIVLVDEAGVHVRSAAALRIAAKLGLPWRALGAALLIPTVIRDTVYRIIARNRYRWFGYKEACMVPTPDIAERFLDADEPTRPIEIHDPTERDPHEGGWLRAWAVRLLIVYLLLYMAPFPLTVVFTFLGLPLISDIPWIGSALGSVVGIWSQFTNWLVTFTGGLVFDVETVPRATGSGAQTFNYVELFVDFAMALVLSLGWTLKVRARRLSEMTFDVSRVLARYYLGTFLLVYGWIKVFPLQMPAPGPDRLLKPLGDLSPMGIAWTFIGASSAYQIFSGLSELVAGYLLFWRRTAFAGGLATMAVMLNVMAINYFYDIPVKLFSTHLFLYGLFVAAPDLPRLFGVLAFNLPVASDTRRAFWKRLGWRGRRIAVANLALVAVLTYAHVSNNLNSARTRGFLAETPALEGTYIVESFVQDGVVDRDNEDAARWVRVGVNVPSIATIQRATGEAVRMRMAMDTVAATMSFYDRGDQPPAVPQFTYTEPEPGVLRLEGDFEGKSTVVVMRMGETGGLLVERGFHWINEFPLNR